VDLGITPFNVQLPTGYSLASASTGTTSASGSSAAPGGSTQPVDVVSIGNQLNAGTIDVASGDTYSLASLFKVSPDGPAATAYRVVFGGDGNGQLRLNNIDVSNQTTFTADQFANLNYVPGDDGTTQSLTVVAQNVSTAPHSAMQTTTDSQAVQLTAAVTGARSLSAMDALVGVPADGDASTVSIVKEANILAGTGTRPTVSSIGNFTAQAGETYRVASVFAASNTASGTIQSYHVALDGQGDGELLLNGVNVTGRSSFTTSEYDSLVYVTGSDGTRQDLTVVAQAGTPKSDGSVANPVDSQPVQVTASVTGTRSLNALTALAMPPTDTDANAAAIAREAQILTGTGSGRPTVNTVGNFTAVAGDTFNLSGLFAAAAPAGGQPVAAYRIALSGDGPGPSDGDGSGKLLLNGNDVSSQTSFTADQFSHLVYQVGDDGTAQALTVVAQTGTKAANGTLRNIVDGPPIQISAAATGTRSINAIGALTAIPADADANLATIVKESDVFSGVGAGRPALATAGNFTAVSGDTYDLDALFKATAANTANANGHASSITGYRIALGGSGDGHLLLNGVDVSDQTTFTADQFANLAYVAGSNDSAQSLTVVAQSGTRQPNGTIANRADSTAVQITASVAGTRSMNALAALQNPPPPTDADAQAAAIVREANVLTGTGSGTPQLATVGNLTGIAGDTYSLGALFKATGANGQSISGYRVALGGAGNGTLQLNGVDVSDQTSFTAAQFAQLTYVMGDNGAARSLTVAAQSTSRRAGSQLTNTVDSAPIQINLATTGTRSLNALAALTTTPTDSDAPLAALIRQANVLTGTGSGRPVIETPATAPPEQSPEQSLAALAAAVGSYQTSGMPTTNPAAATTPVDLAGVVAGAIGGSATAGGFTNPASSLTAALLMLDGGAIGSYQVGLKFTDQSTAIRAYTS
jgi:hypothetical protein